MSWLSSIAGKIFGGGVKEVADSVVGIVDKFVETDEEKQAWRILKTKIEQEKALWQTEITKIEAAHKSVFVAGWRPAIGWVCALSLMFYFVPQYVVGTFLWAKTCLASGAITAYPVSAEGLMQLVFGMLGIAALRTYEKKEGLTQ